MKSREFPLEKSDIFRPKVHIKHKWFHIVTGVAVFAVMGIGPGVYFYSKMMSEQPVANVTPDTEIQAEGQVAAGATAPAAQIPSNIPAREPTTAPTEAPIVISVRNGSGITGLAKRMGEKIEEIVPGSTIIASNAASFRHKETLVVGIDSTRKDIVKMLASQLEASVAALPSAEPVPDASILIIVGAKNILQ